GGADGIGPLHGQHEPPAVADLSRPRGFHDRADRLVGDRVGHDDLDLHLRQQAHVVFLAAVNRRVPLLLAVPAHLRHRHPRDIQLRERVLHLVHFARPDDGLKQFHSWSSSVRCRNAVSACSSAGVSLAPRLVRWNTSMAVCPSVEISTRSMSQPCSEIARLIRYSSPSSSAAAISTTLYFRDTSPSIRTIGATRAAGWRRSPRRRPRSRSSALDRPATTSSSAWRTASEAPGFSARNRSASANWTTSSTRPFGFVIACPRRMSMPNDESTPQMFANSIGLSSVTTVSSHAASVRARRRCTSSGWMSRASRTCS